MDFLDNLEDWKESYNIAYILLSIQVIYINLFQISVFSSSVDACVGSTKNTNCKTLCQKNGFELNNPGGN